MEWCIPRDALWQDGCRGGPPPRIPMNALGNSATSTTATAGLFPTPVLHKCRDRGIWDHFMVGSAIGGIRTLTIYVPIGARPPMAPHIKTLRTGLIPLPLLPIFPILPFRLSPLVMPCDDWCSLVSSVRLVPPPWCPRCDSWFDSGGFWRSNLEPGSVEFA